MNTFNPNLYRLISEYYTQYNGDKNMIIFHILLNMKDNYERVKYIGYVDFYFLIIDTQKNLVKTISEERLDHTFQV